MEFGDADAIYNVITVLESYIWSAALRANLICDFSCYYHRIHTRVVRAAESNSMTEMNGSVCLLHSVPFFTWAVKLLAIKWLPISLLKHIVSTYSLHTFPRLKLRHEDRPFRLYYPGIQIADYCYVIFNPFSISVSQICLKWILRKCF